MTDALKGRAGWVDLCRFLAIFLVAWLHFGAPERIDGFVHSFHIPVFYFMAGYCFSADRHPSFSAFARKRAKRLLCPYFILAGVLYAFWSAVNAAAAPEKLVSFRHWARCVVFPASTDLNNLWGAVQWFLPSLFFAEILFYFPARHIKNPAALFGVTAAVSLAACWALRLSGVRLPLALDTAAVALIFYGAGQWLRRAGFEALRPRHGALLFVLSCGVCVGAYLLNGPVNLRAMTLGSPLLFAAGGLGGSLALALAARGADGLLRASPLQERLLFLGRNTLALLYLHRLFDGLHKTLLALLGVTFPSGAAEHLYLLGMTAVFFLIAGPLIRLGKKFIGRCTRRSVRPGG